MTNVSGTPEKASIRTRLFEAAEEALAAEGWKVERIARSGKSSVRQISKGNVRKIVSIRTTQDLWIAFPRTEDNKAWATLSDVDYVVASSVDDYVKPQFALVHMIPASEMKVRFDRAYAARKKAGYKLPLGRGVWLSLYDKEAAVPVTLVGAGAGLEHKPIAKVPLFGAVPSSTFAGRAAETAEATTDDRPLTIAEAKRRLAASLGVAESAITITISS